MKNHVVFEPQSTFRSWLYILAILFLSLFGAISSLICIYALPDGTVQPKLGGILFLSSAVTIVFLLSLNWKKERIIARQLRGNASDNDWVLTPIQESVSDKIIKWVVSIYSLFFAFQSVAIALICIYTLPDKTVQPVAGLLYYLGGAFVVGSFVYTVWKRR